MTHLSGPGDLHLLLLQADTLLSLEPGLAFNDAPFLPPGAFLEICLVAGGRHDCMRIFEVGMLDDLPAANSLGRVKREHPGDQIGEGRTGRLQQLVKGEVGLLGIILKAQVPEPLGSLGPAVVCGLA